jgi:amino acid transporter
MNSRLGELKRILGFTTAVAVCVGSAVGSGILRTPGDIAAQLPDAQYIFFVWIFGAVVAGLDILILAEWAAAVPRVGGLVAFLHAAFGRPVAFISGWSILLITWPGSIASVAVAIGEIAADGATSLGSLAPPSPAARGLAIFVIIALGMMNLLGLHLGARFEVLLTTLKVLFLAGLLGAAFFVTSAAPAPAAPVAFPDTLPALVRAVGASLISVIFTFDGYADAVYLSGETKGAERTVPRALFVSLGIITALYVFANAAFLHALGAQSMAASKFVCLDMAEISLGATGRVLLTLVAIVVMAGAVNSYLLTGPRIARLLAEESLALPAFGSVGSRGVPVVATLWLVAVSVLFALTNTYGELLDFIVPIVSLTTIFVAVGLWVDRRLHPDRPRPFRVPAAGWIVGGQVLLGLAFLASAILYLWQSKPWILLADAGAIASGLVIYQFTRARRTTAP